MGPITTAYNCIANCTAATCRTVANCMPSMNKIQNTSISSVWNSTMNSYPVTSTTNVIRNNVTLIVAVIGLAVIAKAISCCYAKCKKAHQPKPEVKNEEPKVEEQNEEPKAEVKNEEPKVEEKKEEPAA